MQGTRLQEIDRVAWRLAADWATSTLQQLHLTGRTVPMQWPRRLRDARLIVDVRVELIDPDERDLLARRVNLRAAELWPDLIRHSSE